jgi:DNA-nicking Smr family endonuclease
VSADREHHRRREPEAAEPEAREPDASRPDPEGPAEDAVGDAGEEAVELPIDGILDLHTFSPRETRELVPDYLDLCRERGILSVRIIHGKGIGVQREIVQAALERHPAVIRYGHPPDGGSWGATVAELAPPEEG